VLHFLEQFPGLNQVLEERDMGFLKRLFKNVFRDGHPRATTSSFENLSEEQLEAHMKIARYGDYVLTDAIRPSFDLQVVPAAGFRHDVYKDKDTGIDIPVIMASASREVIFDLFLELLDPLGQEVDMVLETSHDRSSRGHDDLYREHIDLPVLKSTLCDFEELITNDGCAGVAVLNPSIPLEVQFDEHKLLIMYGRDLTEFENILNSSNIPCCDDMRFITEAEHVHSSSDEMFREFQQLRYRLGLDEGIGGDLCSWNEA
jgi:hypothetical protein